MTHYKFRFLYALGIFLSISVFSYHYLLRDHWSQLQVLEKRRQQYIEKIKLAEQRRQVAVKNQEHHQTPIADFELENKRFSELQTLLVQSGLTLERLHMLPPSSLTRRNIVSLRLTLSGPLPSILSFITKMQQINMMMTDFSVQTKEVNSYRLKMSAFIFLKSELLFNSPSFAMKWSKNPFCQPGSIALSARGTKLTNYSLSQFKLIGTVIAGDFRVALFQLPNETVISLKPGMIVGRERIRLLSIQTKQVVWQYPNQHSKIMRI